MSLIKSVDNEVAGTSESLADINKYTSEYTGVNFEEKDLNINSEYIDAIKKGMLSVTSETGGTSYIVFKNSDIQVAGKTGTAQVPMVITMVYLLDLLHMIIQKLQLLL